MFWTKWRTEQVSCFRPIRLILQPRLTGRNEKGFKDFQTKKFSMTLFSMLTWWPPHNPELPFYTHTPSPVSPVHDCNFISPFLNFKQLSRDWALLELSMIHVLDIAKHLSDGETTNRDIVRDSESLTCITMTWRQQQTNVWPIHATARTSLRYNFTHIYRCTYLQRKSN